ncbi:hypothetical protein [Chitinophaga arvensicola]|uniref:Uncharacterized protein n=1 Tax=Chitinophaga arvensicola TaxID=29529 RepID=A0A1I0SAM9_9BACT|nr:hypothetical protein [Chitinophaga arvensicola]SEW53403.1 hypothetical protein SAMN04488122_5446 [Chitinophaga arvensicola]
MAKQSKDAVKTEIQELAIGNYKSYPDDYETAPAAVSENIDSLAKGYWDSREYKEVERDERLGIHLEDYQHWTKEAYDAFMASNQSSMN